jgi:hypothetical protein
MADPRDQEDFDLMGKWLLANQGKAGTPEFTEMANAYKSLEGTVRAQPVATAQPVTPQPADANSWGNIAGRVGTDAVLGIPDLGIAAYNAFIAGDDGRVRPLGERVRSAMGVAELPEDASWGQRLLESGASGLLTGGAGVVRAGAKEGLKAGLKTFGKTVVAPTVGGDAGAQVGGLVGGEKGALIGGVLGGGVAPHGKAIGENWVQGRYVGKGAANAPEIAAAAERLGINPTAGALGNYDIQKRENRYAAQDPSGRTAQAQETQRNAMTSVGEDIGAQRGGTGQGPAAMGDDIRGATADRLAADRDYSSAGQENLQRTVGDRAPVRVIDIIDEARQAYPHLSVPARQALEHRINNQLLPLISQRDAQGNPIIGPNTTVPYELVKQWRTELGQSFEQGRIPRNRELYEPATNAMAETAQGAGVPRGDFDAVQSFTRGVEGEGGLADRLAPYDKEPNAAYNYTMEGGLKNPDRLSTFATETAGDPRQRVFGDYLQQKVADTIGSGQAQGMNKFAQFVEGTDPRALSTIAGPQAGRLQDLATLSRGVDVPTSQRGLSTSVAGPMNTLGGKFIGSEMLGHAFGASGIPGSEMVGRGIGYMARPTIDKINQRILQSEAAKRGMLRQPMAHRMTMEDLIHTLNMIGQSQPPASQTPQ